MPTKGRGRSDAGAGAASKAGNRPVATIEPTVRSTLPPGTGMEIGGFGGLFDLGRVVPATAGSAGADRRLDRAR